MGFFVQLCRDQAGNAHKCKEIGGCNRPVVELTGHCFFHILYFLF
ncbi:hypothetical protein CLOSTASPAR_06427 [[Clostridium] asparagiforme DSM 15981]|uniref:Uncharacterized protein n=1 Tax=[Clostridium] asparagiforme DSM 15981 TaxID=518636 RepID=C0DAX2_9FIRM|nr:hypothetical protein CLOSTASPAR_06427 [[Clostridium] asparagiforme DSM 15981]